MTFQDPDGNLIKQTKSKGKKTDPKVSDQNVQEVTQLVVDEEMHERTATDYVMTRPVITTQDVDPAMGNIPEAELKKIVGFTEADFNRETAKERWIKYGFLIWQSKQLFYTAYIKESEDPKTGTIKWEERKYTYHPLNKVEKREARKKGAEVERLRQMQAMLGAGLLDRVVMMDIMNNRNLSEEIIDAEDASLYYQFKLYFKETDDNILDLMRTEDMRDLLDAALFRETNLPFSRQLQSFKSISK